MTESLTAQILTLLLEHNDLDWTTAVMDSQTGEVYASPDYFGHASTWELVPAALQCFNVHHPSYNEALPKRMTEGFLYLPEGRFYNREETVAKLRGQTAHGTLARHVVSHLDHDGRNWADSEDFVYASYAARRH